MAQDDIRSYDAPRFAAMARHRREALHLTQVQLAKKLGVTGGYISQLEGGRMVEMTLRFHQAYARALEMPFPQYADEAGLDLVGVSPIDQNLTEQRELFLQDIADLPDDDIEKLRELTRQYRRLGMLGPAESAPREEGEAEQEETEGHED